MNNLKEELTKIHNFVNTEFNIENEVEVEAVKATLSLEKIEMLDNMLKEYKKALKKAINAEKRKEALRQAQKNYKNIQANLKLEEYLPIEEKSIELKISISELVKLSLRAFLAPKKVEAIQIPTEKVDNALKGKYEALERDLKVKVNTILELNTNNSKLEQIIEDKKTSDSLEISKLKIEKTEIDTELEKINIQNTELLTENKKLNDTLKRFDDNHNFRLLILGFALLGINSLAYLIINFFYPLNLI